MQNHRYLGHSPSDLSPKRSSCSLYRFCGNCPSRGNGSSNQNQASYCLALLERFPHLCRICRIGFPRRNIIISSFAEAVREATFSPRNQETLVEGTVNATVTFVAQAFRTNSREDPRLDADRKTCFLHQEQYRGYGNQDKARAKQKALPASVLRRMFEWSSSPWEMAVTWLLVLAFFFAMRSCEYLTASYPEESKQTKKLRLKNIIFKKQGRIVPHSSHLALLAAADLVIVTFEFQKNNLRDHSVHMFRTPDPLLCPVKAAAHIVVRVRSIINLSNDTKICSFMTTAGKVVDINSAQVRARLRAVVSLIGEASLGFPAVETGLHSIRSGAAIAMFLSGVSTIIIQRVGRWKSDAFLEYIRDQVENFTAGSQNVCSSTNISTPSMQRSWLAAMKPGMNTTRMAP
jgi:hypothetical protein